MRKHCVRKWIHAICDLLPLLVIPIFALAVRSDNNYQPISITTGGYEYRNKYQTNDIETDIDNFENNYLYHCNGLDFCGDDGLDCGIAIVNCGSLIKGNASIDEFLFDGYFNDNCTIFVNSDGYGSCSLSFYFDSEYDNYITFSFSDEFIIYDFDFYTDASDTFLAYYLMQNGSYNGLSASNYVEIEYIYNEGVTYNDTDVGSQMVYTLYNTCDKYFNFNRIGVFNDLYGWFKTNLFNGANVPLSFTIVWNTRYFAWFVS